MTTGEVDGGRYAVVPTERTTHSVLGCVTYDDSGTPEQPGVEEVLHLVGIEHSCR